MSNRILEHVPANAKGSDLVRMAIMSHLLSQLPWLRNGYAMAQLIQDKNGNKIYATFSGGIDYVDLMPNGTKGSYSFLFNRSVKVKNAGPRNAGQVRSDVVDADLNFFFDFRHIDANNSDNLTEMSVYELVQSALSSFNEPGVSIEPKAIFTDPETVFYPSSLVLADAKLLRRPYGCLSIDLRITVSDIFYCKHQNRAN